ncbi:hypothetical protein BLOT_010433, partial [Blomia tropicalis]
KKKNPIKPKCLLLNSKIKINKYCTAVPDTGVDYFHKDLFNDLLISYNYKGQIWEKLKSVQKANNNNNNNNKKR